LPTRLVMTPIIDLKTTVTLSISLLSFVSQQQDKA
jgi:hypothetical protein